jgi:transcriptional regulator with XRE-family HTH domain
VVREEFVASLAAERRRRRLSQTRLARRVGVTQQVLSAWETGAARPTRAHLAAWAIALEVAPFPEGTRPVREQCGQYKGYQMHKRRHETPCDPCRDANTKYMVLYRWLRQHGTSAAATSQS